MTILMNPPNRMEIFELASITGVIVQHASRVFEGSGHGEGFAFVDSALYYYDAQTLAVACIRPARHSEK